MERKTRIWLGLGAAVLVGSNATVSSAVADAGGDDLLNRFSGLQLAQAEGGEGGGEGADPLSDYRLNSTDPNAFQYDAAPQVAAYAAVASQTYTAAHAGGVALQESVAVFLANPTAQTLAAARGAWINARAAYMQTEVFRFYGGPIDGVLETRLNAWPTNEAFIDGVINDASKPVSFDTILVPVNPEREASARDFTTGWHAIEYLLWGKDTNAKGPGARPHTDYVAGRGMNDRRRDYLRLATDLLVNDLSTLVAVWAPGSQNHRSSLEVLDHRNVVGRAFLGMAVLGGYELPVKRIGAGLANGGPETDHSPYSDNTTAELINGLLGIRNVYFGAVAKAGSAGFNTLLARIDSGLDNRVVAALERAERAVMAIPAPFDRVLASPKGSPARAKAEEAVAALRDLGLALRTAGNRLGTLVIVPGL